MIILHTEYKMFLYLFTIPLVSGVFTQIGSYDLSSSLGDKKFELTKGLNSDSMLLIIKINDLPYFGYENSTNSWNISYDYYDTEDWAINSNTLDIRIPGNIVGKANIGIYTYRSPGYYTLKQSVLSPSMCLSVCNNGGQCLNGVCECLSYYGGYDCSQYIQPLFLNTETPVEILGLNWMFYRVQTNKMIKLNGLSTSQPGFYAFGAPEVTSTELPSMLDSNGFYFDGEDPIDFYINGDGNSIRIGLYCYSSSACRGSLTAEEINKMNYTWVVIFFVIIGCLFVASMPLVLIYYKRIKNRVACIEISKEHMENMFPCKEFIGEINEMCPICIESLAGNKMCRELPCYHFFHEDCIDEWGQKNPTCPMCKRNFVFDYNEGQKERNEFITDS